MHDAQQLVAAFHRAFDIAMAATPAIPDAATCALRVTLIQEEFDELREALAQQDIEAVAKELADLLYVVYGTAVSCGVNMRPVFEEVHRSNMSKVGGHKRADGKWIKPPDYSPARLQPILAAQMAQQAEAAASPPQKLTPRADDIIVASSATGETAPPRPPGMIHALPKPPVPALLPDTTPAIEYPKAGYLRRDARRGREVMGIRCARCGKNFIRRAHRNGVFEYLLSCLCIYPFRCQVCGRRFKMLRLRMQYAKRPVDRRKNARVVTRLAATFTEAIVPGEQRMGQGIVTDLSLGGCYLHTDVRLVEGTTLSLEVQMPQGAPTLVIDAVCVRFVRSAGVGLEFLRCSTEGRERLGQYIQELLRIQRGTVGADADGEADC
ncbi:MAG: hypothetical protein FJZ47_07365 [Candidatus Tectomicrobia bacterium]|uniref:PilZ domain-containing protein n=1 Tax=Tectimicrobiota bacterium TaxID=2528274 RepID=A0A938B3A4_UNCTE|nr:hypothetical protein [Candidatus Tectomicrobia bacterium]